MLLCLIQLSNVQDKKVVVLANLKPRNMRGIKSNGMLMAASDASHENVELLVPPEDSIPGERIWFGSEEDKENQPAAASPNQVCAAFFYLIFFSQQNDELWHENLWKMAYLFGIYLLLF